MSRAGRQRLAYAGFLALAFMIALTASWTQLGTQIDNYVYDWMFRLYSPQPWQTQSIVLAIDEPSLSAFGGRLGFRKALAKGLERIAVAHPRARTCWSREMPGNRSTPAAKHWCWSSLSSSSCARSSICSIPTRVSRDIYTSC